MAGSDDLMQGLHDLGAARPGYGDAWEFWDCDRPEEFANPAVRRALSSSAGKYGVNIAQLPISALADRLEISAITALTTDGRTDDQADETLQGILTANKMDIQWGRLIRNTLIYGDGYMFAWQGDTPGSVSLSYNSPTIARVIYDDDNELEVLYGIKQWKARGVQRASLLYGDHLELGWVLKDGANADEAKSWHREADAQDVPNEWGVPLHHFRTDMPFGRPMHRDAFGPQDAVNKFSTTMTYSGEASGLKGRYALTDPAAALNGDAADSPDWDDDEEATEDNRDDSRLRNGPGEMQILTGVKAVGEWSAPDPMSFIRPMDQYTRYAALVTSTPSRYADPGGQHPSGSALRVADAPFASKVARLQKYFTDSTRGLAVYALRVAGVPDARVGVRWTPPGIVDDVDTWQIVQAKIQAGVPAVVAITDTGLYEQDRVEKWMSDANVEMDVSRRVWLLADLASAVAQLGQGVALGLLDEAQARDIIQITVGQLTPQVEGDVTR